MITFYWDFFGPNSEKTARHFEHHLVEFLKNHAIEGAHVGIVVETEGHASAFCVPPEESREAIGRALRPRRVEEGDPPSVDG